MKSLKKIFLLLAFTFILLNACEYEPKDIYYRKVNTNVTQPDVQSVDLNLPGDTVFLYSDRIIRFTFTSSDQAIITVRFQIDTLPAYDSRPVNGSFYFENYRLLEGGHTLKMEVITHSGTGSIADSMGAEGFSIKREWVLIVFHGVTYPISMTNKDGLLKLSWPPYRGTDLIEYVITRQTDWFGYHYAEVKRVTTNEFVDSSYVGESAYYKVEAVNGLNRRLNWGNITIKNNMPNPMIVSDMQNNYSFRWNKNLYYGAIDTTVLEMYSNSRYVPLKTTTDASDTSIVASYLFFGDQVRIRLRTVPKKYNVCYTFGNESFMTVKEGTMGFNFAKSSNNYYYLIDKINSDEFIFSEVNNGLNPENDTLYRFSFKYKTITEKYTRLNPVCHSIKIGGPIMSPGGKYLAFETDCDKRVVMVNSDNLKVEKTAYFQYHQNMSGFYGIPVTETGLVYINKTYAEGFVVWDMIGNKIVAEYANGSVSKVSLTGEYVLHFDQGPDLLQFKDGAYNIIRTFGSEEYVGNFAFSPTDPQLVYYWGGSVFTVRNCADFAIINQFPLTGQMLKNVDFVNKQILTYGNGYFYVRDMETGSLISEIPINPQYGNSYVWYLMDNTIISFKGAMYFINQ